MSHARETPRQKMINLMYLVLTCLLALNVSKEVLQGFVTINESIETTNSNFTGNTKKILEAVDEAIKAGHHEFEPYRLKSRKVVQMTDSTFHYIDSLKRKLIAYTEDVEGADTLQLAFVEKLDDYDKPTFFLIGADETKPTSGKYSAGELRHTLRRLTDSLNATLDYMKDRPGLKLPPGDYQILKDKIRAFTPGDHYKDKDGEPLTWEVKNFYNLPLAAVITNLSKIQGDLRNIEGEMIGVFASAPGKLAVKFNELQARIIPVSGYIQAGSPYMADVLLSAASTDFKEDNLQFILGEVDTATGKLSAEAKMLPIERGIGKISLPTGGTGHKEIAGWIKFREGTGRYRYLRYTNEYIVAPAAVAVSPDKMNVFYAGVENPVTISAAGVAPGDLVVRITGCNGEMAPAGNGKYVARVAGTGNCEITVFQKTGTGLKQQGAPQVFRVKKIPSPPLKINGKTVISNLDMKPQEARNIAGLGVDNTGFDFGATFKVLQYVITIGGGGVPLQQFKCSESKLPEDARRAFERLKPGARIYFEDIKVQAPDGPREFPMVKVSIR